MQASTILSLRKPIVRHNTVSFNRNNNNAQYSNSTQPTNTKDTLNWNQMSTQLRLSSAKKNTTTCESISQTTTLPTSIRHPINLKKHNTIINGTYLQTFPDEEEQNDDSSQRSKSFKPANAISVAERKLIRRVTRRLRDESRHNTNRIIQTKREVSSMRPRMKSKPPFHRQMNLNLETQSSISSNNKPKKKKTNINTKTRNLKNSLYILRQQDPNYFLTIGVKEKLGVLINDNKKYKKPNILGSFKALSGNIMKPLSSCSLYMKKRTKKPNLTQRLIKAHNNDFMTVDFKQAIKWEGIRQLWQNHSITLEHLIKNYKGYKWFLEKDEFITERALKEFMRLIEIESTNEFFIDTFELFSYEDPYINKIHKDKVMNIKEFFQCIIITSLNVSFDVKIEMLFDIWEIVHTNIINIKEVICLLKGYFYYMKDYEIFANMLHKQFPNEKGTHIERNVFYKYIMTNSKIKKILYRNLCFDQKLVEEMFKEEVVNVVNSNERSWKSHLNYYDLKTYCNGFVNRLDLVLNSMYQAEQKKMLTTDGKRINKNKYEDEDDD